MRLSIYFLHKFVTELLTVCTMYKTPSAHNPVTLRTARVHSMHTEHFMRRTGIQTNHFHHIIVYVIIFE